MKGGLIKMDYDYQVHTIEPVWDTSSTILILGSFPSVKSRETAFFYGHPQNRFWRVLASIWKEEVPKTIEEKKRFLKAHHIALWDVIGSCKIIGSQDSSIREVVPNPIEELLTNAPIQRIFTNGGKAYELYQSYLLPKLKKEAVQLPSTSPANASFSLERLIQFWQIIKDERMEEEICVQA